MQDEKSKSTYCKKVIHVAQNLNSLNTREKTETEVKIWENESRKEERWNKKKTIMGCYVKVSTCLVTRINSVILTLIPGKNVC